MTSESIAGRTVIYQRDAAGNVTSLSYPSGVSVTRQIDALDRLDTIPGVADYVCRGPDLVAERSQGNLTEKGNLRFHWDYRNRLTRVTDSVGTEIASYTYDAFNRRIAKAAGGVTEETVWAGWQPLERYAAGQLAERRTYGAGLDEVVRIESDHDGDGVLERSYTPVYDHTGNLAVVTDSTTGQVIERYRLTPYGERTILVDSTPPAVEQLRVQDGALWLEISEGVNTEALQAALAAGAVTLTETAASTELALTATQPVQEGGQAFRRVVLTVDTAPADGTPVELNIEPAALIDAFGNQLAASYVQSFDWPAGDQVVDDTAAPTVEAVRLVDRFVEIELSEEPDLATVETAVTVDGAQLSWALGADRYTVRSAEALNAGSVTLSVATTLADLAGTTLAGPLSEAVPAVVTDVELFEAPDPRESAASMVGNRAGFQGLDHDPDTGLVYLRNRWLDPELGRFLQPDPLSYFDGPTLYGLASNNPSDFSDPLGLTSRTAVLDENLYYTWNFGWVDTTHAQGQSPDLERAWKLLRHSPPLRKVRFPLRMTQGTRGSFTYRASTFHLEVTVAATLRDRKRQLLYAYQRISEDFEAYQGEGLQGSQGLTTLWGVLQGEQQRIASSFSTEDLFSNLLNFHAVIEGRTIEDLVASYGGQIDLSERREFSLLVWDYALRPTANGAQGWKPILLDPAALPTLDEVMARTRLSPNVEGYSAVRDRIRRDLGRLEKLVKKYRGLYGVPALAPALTLRPLSAGVRILSRYRD